MEIQLHFQTVHVSKFVCYFRGTGHHSQCDIPSVIPSWILNLFKMTAKMDHNDAIEIQRILITSFLNTMVSMKYQQFNSKTMVSMKYQQFNQLQNF